MVIWNRLVLKRYRTGREACDACDCGRHQAPHPRPVAGVQAEAKPNCVGGVATSSFRHHDCHLRTHNLSSLRRSSFYSFVVIRVQWI